MNGNGSMNVACISISSINVDDLSLQCADYFYKEPCATGQKLLQVHQVLHVPIVVHSYVVVL